MLAAVPLATFDSAAALASSPSASASVLTLAQAAPEFSDVGRPRRRQGGGSRGSCLIADRPPLTALVPASATGYTQAASPSFWFYLPYSLTQGHSLEFVLKDSQDNLVYRQTIAGDKTAPGLFSLRLPQSVALDTSQSYEWYLLVQCDAENAERFVFVNGAVRRVEQPASQQLWYDALDQAAVQIQTAPQDQDSQENWRALLQSVGLADLATEPIVPCCDPELPEPQAGFPVDGQTSLTKPVALRILPDGLLQHQLAKGSASQPASQQASQPVSRSTCKIKTLAG